MDTIAKRIKIMRIVREMTQTDLANAAGLHRSTIAMIETGERRMFDFQIAGIAKALQVTTDFLLNGEPVPSELTQPVEVEYAH